MSNRLISFSAHTRRRTDELSPSKKMRPIVVPYFPATRPKPTRYDTVPDDCAAVVQTKSVPLKTGALHRQRLLLLQPMVLQLHHHPPPLLLASATIVTFVRMILATMMEAAALSQYSVMVPIRCAIPLRACVNQLLQLHHHPTLRLFLLHENHPPLLQMTVLACRKLSISKSAYIAISNVLSIT